MLTLSASLEVLEVSAALETAAEGTLMPSLELYSSARHFRIGSAVFVVRVNSYASKEYSKAGVLTGAIAVPDSTS